MSSFEQDLKGAWNKTLWRSWKRSLHQRYTEKMEGITETNLKQIFWRRGWGIEVNKLLILRMLLILWVDSSPHT